MRFLHTADWHLGRQFHHVSLLDDQRYVLQQLTDYAVSQHVDAVIIAGDIYDRSVPPAPAVRLLDEVLHRLSSEHGIPVIMIPGNHDSAERLRFGSRQLEQAGLHIISDLDQITQPVIIKDAEMVCHIYGIPYADPVQVGATEAKKFSDHDAAHTYLVDKITSGLSHDVVNMLISHCFVAGNDESDSERPLSVGGADQVSSAPLSDFVYVALGHLHSPQTCGSPTVRYSGSLLKYSFSEQHQNKGVTLVTINHDQTVSTEFLSLKPLHDVRIIEGELDDILRSAQQDPNADDYVMIRLNDRHAILDALSKLREGYPNILHLEKPGVMSTGTHLQLERQKLSRGELAMFRDFFQQMTGDSLSDAQEKILSSTIDALRDS